MSYDVGTVVWVKIKGKRIWWVGQVTNDFPEDLLDGNRTVPLAVVKFFSNEDEFELVKKENEIFQYNCPKKEEFIKKGKVNLKDKSDLETFISDCKQAETLTGGTVDLIDSLGTSQTPKKLPEYAGLFKSTPPPQKSAHEYAGLVKLSFKKPGSPSKKSTPSPAVEGRKYNCDQCSFTTDRLNAFTSHRKNHLASPSSSVSPSPVKPQSSPAKAKSPLKSASPEKSPKKSTPVKSPGPRRGKKRKSVVEATPTTSAADKQDILADWSDAEGSADSPHPEEDLEPKKPRTDKELSDAFESLLKTTKPPVVGDKPERAEEAIDIDEPEVASDVEEDVVLNPDNEEVAEEIKEESVEKEVPEVEVDEKSVVLEESDDEYSSSKTKPKSPEISFEKPSEESIQKVVELTIEEATPPLFPEGTTDGKEEFQKSEDRSRETAEEVVVEQSKEAVEEVAEVDQKIPELINESSQLEGSSESFVELTLHVESESVPELPVESESVPELPVESESVPELPVESDSVPKLPVESESVPELPVESEQISEFPSESETVSELPIECESKPVSEFPSESETVLELPSESETVSEVPIECETASELQIESVHVLEEPIPFPVISFPTEKKKDSSETLRILEDPAPKHIVEPVKNSPTAKVFGITKATPSLHSPEPIEQIISQETSELLDDAELLQHEVDALLAATKPVEINHEQLFSTRPDLHYKVSPTKLKSDQSISIAASTGAGLEKIPAVPIAVAKNPILQPHSVSTTGKTTGSVTALKSDSAMSNVTISPRTMARPITTAEAMSIKANSAGELVMQQGGTGILRMTRPNAPSGVVVQDKIVILQPDSQGLVKSPPPGVQVQLQQQLQQKSAFQNQQSMKMINSAGATPVATIITSNPPASATAIKKVRAKKQTLVERGGATLTASGIMAQQAQIMPQASSAFSGQFTPLTASQFLSSGPKIQGPAAPVQTVQSLQTKVHALPITTLTPGVRPTTAGTGMVRQASTIPSASKQYQPQRASSPAILKTNTQPYRHPRQQAPVLIQSGSHYEIVTSTPTVAGRQDANEMLVISQASATSHQPQQQYLLTSAPAMPSPQAVAITSARRKSPLIKRAVPGPPIFKVPDVRPKPTAAVKPTLSEEEQSLTSAVDPKIRQALLAGQKTEKILAAEKVVHLLPIQNPDGTVTYMLVQLDDSGTGMRIDQADGNEMIHEGPIDPIYLDSEVQADRVLATVVRQNPPGHAKKTVARKTPVKGTPVAPRAKVSTTQQSVLPSSSMQLQGRQQSAAQPRQFVIGQQQQLQQQYIQIQSSPKPTTHQYQQIQASTPAPAPTLSNVSLSPQKQATIPHQHVQRQVFVSQPQQIHLPQHQPQATTTSVQKVTSTTAPIPVTELRTLQIQQESPIQSTATPLVPMTSERVYQKPQQSVQAQDQLQQIQMQVTQVPQAEEPQMPALIETKVADTTALQGQPQHQQEQQVHYVIQSQTGEMGELEGVNLEIPLNMQDYLQVVTGEDGNQYYVTPEGLVGADPNQQAYIQIATEDGQNVTYDYSGLEGEQFYIVQDDGTFLVSPQSLEVDLSQVLALQQQQMELEQQHVAVEATETIIQGQNDNHEQPQPNP